MILQSHIPFDTTPRALPGIQPLQMADWLNVDDAYAAQMAERCRLLKKRETDVLRIDPGATAAAQELLECVLLHLGAGQGFQQVSNGVRCPDGRHVLFDRERPLHTLCQIAQEDFCILQKRGDEHVLTAAALCFPASWTLAEKYLKPLITIHGPVEEYDSQIAARVQRLFNGVKPGRPLWRFNYLPYADPTLFQPRLETDPRGDPVPQDAEFLRSERQSILRLPQTDAVVFSIHTYVVRR